MNLGVTHDCSVKDNNMDGTNGSLVNNAPQRSSSEPSISRENHDKIGTDDIKLQRKGSFDVIRGLGLSRRRNSLSLSCCVGPQLSYDNYESEIVSEAGDIGDRTIQSNMHSQSGSGRLNSIDNLAFIENGFGLPPQEQFLETYGFWFQNRNALSTTAPVTPLPSDIVSPLLADDLLGLNNQNRSKLDKPIKEDQKKLPMCLEYILYLIHLAVFGILGSLTRYLLQKLFGPSVAGVTSDETALYLDLPSNMLGSFLMGWFGVVFKADISQVSDYLAIGLSTGYLGSLTTFSSWNQKMLNLSVNGQWVVAAVACLIGTFLAVMSITFGIQTANGFRWLLNRIGKEGGAKSETQSLTSKWKIENIYLHLAVLVVLLLILGLLWGVSGAMLRNWLYDRRTGDTYLWLACLVAPAGVWIRWLLARLNGRGLGKNGSMKWIPLGTLIANISAASMMAALATLMKVVNTEKCYIIATGLQFGFLGCLSTVSTFMAEYHAMSQSSHPWRAHVYAAITLLPSFGLGTLIYSVPVWVKGYH